MELVKIQTKSGSIVHVELQMWFIPEMKERSIFYQSKMVTEQILSGQDYSIIKRVVSIVITDYELIPGDDDYIHQFRYRTKDGREFTDLTEINTLELCKLPANADNSEHWYWMEFIKTDRGDVLDMLAEKNPKIKKAAGVLKELSADERNRMLFDEQEKIRRDIVSMMGGAKREGIIEGIKEGTIKGLKEGEIKGRKEGEIKAKTEVAKNLLKLNLPIEEIIKCTGLTLEEVENLTAVKK
ncbi:MAG: Rpn family recombination-promoting nuclease/putative transposase [Clostridiales bacterium]|nr:Rpn family recombination-promoting nuclease/putative transposase [Clostridiales bacterium]